MNGRYDTTESVRTRDAVVNGNRGCFGCESFSETFKPRVY